MFGRDEYINVSECYSIMLPSKKYKDKIIWAYGPKGSTPSLKYLTKEEYTQNIEELKKCAVGSLKLITESDYIFTKKELDNIKKIIKLRKEMLKGKDSYISIMNEMLEYYAELKENQVDDYFKTLESF